MTRSGISCAGLAGASGDVLACEQLGLLDDQQGVDDQVHLPRHHPLEPVDGFAQALVADPILFEVVGPDLLAAIAAADHGAPVRGDLLLLLPLHPVEEPVADPPPRLLLFLLPPLPPPPP